MTRILMVSLAALLLPAGASVSVAPDVPTYTATGEMNLPPDYREWVFLSSGLDISYTSATAAASGRSVFQNVFVNPSAYRAYVASGTWPDKTTLVLEIRGAAPKVGIDLRGQTQTTIRGIEVHVKDSSRIARGDHWGFFEFGSGKTAKLTERTASCYTCHEAHGAVDTTFVQFYPTLMRVAESRHTLSAEYLKELQALPASPVQ